MVKTILVLLGTIAAMLGLEKFTGLIDYLVLNVDAIWAAVLVIVGAVTTVWGHLRKEKNEEVQPIED